MWIVLSLEFVERGGRTDRSGCGWEVVGGGGQEVVEVGSGSRRRLSGNFEMFCTELN